MRREKKKQAQTVGRRRGDESDNDRDEEVAAHAAAADPFFKAEADPFSDPFFQVRHLQSKSKMCENGFMCHCLAP